MLQEVIKGRTWMILEQQVEIDSIIINQTVVKVYE